MTPRPRCRSARSRRPDRARPRARFVLRSRVDGATRLLRTTLRSHPDRSLEAGEGRGPRGARHRRARSGQGRPARCASALGGRGANRPFEPLPSSRGRRHRRRERDQARGDRVRHLRLCRPLPRGRGGAVARASLGRIPHDRHHPLVHPARGLRDRAPRRLDEDRGAGDQRRRRRLSRAAGAPRSARVPAAAGRPEAAGQAGGPGLGAGAPSRERSIRSRRLVSCT